MLASKPRSGRLLSLVHVRTLKMTDDVLSVRYSPNGKFLAVALLDSTVKVFYQDSLKFFLSLYGHKVRQSHLLLRADDTHISAASGALDGHLGRLQAHRDLLCGQERKDMGPRLRRLPPLDLRA